MKFGAKITDISNITYFTQLIATVSKLCSKTSNKTCILKLTYEKIYFIFTDSLTISPGSGKTTFWMCIETLKLFDLYICEGKSKEENFIILELEPDNLFKALKSSQNIRAIRIKLCKRQTPCLSIELDLPSISALKTHSRIITHDISVHVVSSKSFNFEEPTMLNANLSINLPQIKLLKHMLERFKYLTDYINLQATQNGELIFKCETSLITINTFFKDLQCLNVQEPMDAVNVRLNIKKLFEFINALQFQPNKLICNFVNDKYAHLFFIHQNVILQYIIASVYN
jgi:HUS1 checkpoint protein